MFNIAERDILRSKEITPGFYLTKIENAYEDVAGTDGSKVIKFEGIIVEGEFAGVPLNWQFSEKAPGFAIPFFRALGAPIGVAGSELEKGGSMNEKNAIGKTIKVGVKNEMYQGRKVNRADQFLPADAPV